MEYMSITEAAAVLGVSRQRVHAMVKAGILEAERIGSQWAVRKASVEARLEEGKSAPA